jgi:gluconokinase
MLTKPDNVGRPIVVVVMGPAGCGKTTVGRVLAERLRVPFEDADAFHTAPLVERMRRGLPLSDEDRQPWLATLAQRLAAAEREPEHVEPEHAGHQPTGLVLACSALKATYRAELAVGQPFPRRLAYLAVPEQVLRTRLAERAGHFAGPALLDSQLAALEVPASAETYDGTSSPEALVGEMLERMNLRPPG